MKNDLDLFLIYMGKDYCVKSHAIATVGVLSWASFGKCDKYRITFICNQSSREAKASTANLTIVSMFAQ
jgi:hypothetical protein